MMTSELDLELTLRAQDGDCSPYESVREENSLLWKTSVNAHGSHILFCVELTVRRATNVRAL